MSSKGRKVLTNNNIGKIIVIDGLFVIVIVLMLSSEFFGGFGDVISEDGIVLGFFGEIDDFKEVGHCGCKDMLF